MLMNGRFQPGFLTRGNCATASMREVSFVPSSINFWRIWMFLKKQRSFSLRGFVARW